MMRSIVRWSLRFRIIVVAMAAAMMFLGVERLPHMPVDAFPEFGPPEIRIQTLSWGLSADETESLVTIPLEDAMNGTKGLAVLRSRSVPDLSQLELVFEDGTDILEARQLVQERLDLVLPNLPTWAAPPVILPPLSATSRVLKIGLTSDTVSLLELSTVAYWDIRTRLLDVPGVANISIWGERLQMLAVEIDPDRLKDTGITLNQIMETTSDSLDVGILKFSDGAVIGTGGFMDTPNQRLGIRYVVPIVTPDDLSKAAINGRASMTLSDVANVVEANQPLFGDAVINGGPGLMIVVEKFPWANTLHVTRGVESALDELRPGLPGVTVDSTIFRAASFIEVSIDNLTEALLIGCLLVIVILGLFLFEWRTALISAVAIPLSLVAAGLVLYLRGSSVNVMVLAGFVIAVGVVVDDAIIDVENIWRRLRERGDGIGARAVAGIVLEASVEVRSAIVYATLIDVVALLPVLFMGGLSGLFFRPLAVSYALAVLASLLVALTVTPALALLLLAKAPKEHRGQPLLRWIDRGYSALLLRIIQKPQVAYGAVAVIVLLGLAVLPQLGQSLFPTFRERDFLMHWISKPGTSQPAQAEIVTKVGKDLLAIPGVRSFGSHIGQAILGEEVAGVDFSENWISIEPDADYDETLDAIDGVIENYPGLYRDVQTYLNERIGEVLAGSSHPIVVRIFGPDLAVLRTKAEEVRKALINVDGIEDLHSELQTDVPQIHVEVDLDAARQYGIKPGDVRRAAATWVAGEEVADLFRDGRTFDVVVWSTPESRDDLTDISNILIDLPRPVGGYVRLGDIATVTTEPAPNVIKRENASRRIDVEADVGDRALASVVSDIRERLDKIEFPHGYHAELLGEEAEREAAQKHLYSYGIVAAIAVFVLLQMSFGSWRLASLSFLTFPSAIVGALIAVYVSGGIVSLGALVGFFTVLGIAGRNKIMLINHYQHLERFEGMTFGPELILRGARERLSPILMTALATGLALIPLAISGERAGHEIEHPMAIVILGGLVTSTLLNLFIVPVLYLHFGKEWAFKRKKAAD